ncbi:MAG: ral stress protein [Belnapia sp.]|jgi:general stress protein YciG|nr:ral stress protein [Belnapia sp.]
MGSATEKAGYSMANQQTSTGGGNGNPGNFANDRQKARIAGQLGGMKQGKASNPGNFANNREKAAAAGRKGGQHSHGSKAQSQDRPGQERLGQESLG